MKKYYGLIGLSIMVIMQVSAWLGVSVFNRWTTAIGWYGYILFFDWLAYRKTYESLLTAAPKEFLLMLPMSVLLWGIFELHNFSFHNWKYKGFFENNFVNAADFIIAFASILPALYVTVVFLKAMNIFNFRIHPQIYTKRRLFGEISLGLGLIGVSVMFPSLYTGPLVWPGYMLVFPALNHLTGLPSIFNERARGRMSETLEFLAAGYICGIFWELFNFWSAAKWVYNVPFLEHIKIFEMPVIGFLGFGPFGIAFIEMYRFIRYFPLRRIKY